MALVISNIDWLQNEQENSHSKNNGSVVKEETITPGEKILMKEEGQTDMSSYGSLAEKHTVMEEQITVKIENDEVCRWQVNRDDTAYEQQTHDSPTRKSQSNSTTVISDRMQYDCNDLNEIESDDDDKHWMDTRTTQCKDSITEMINHRHEKYCTLPNKPGSKCLEDCIMPTNEKENPKTEGEKLANDNTVTLNTDEPLRCRKSFSYCSLLSRHKMIHTRERAHKCSVCGKSFTSATSLTKHSAVKSCSFLVSDKLDSQKVELCALDSTQPKVKPYSCDVCAKSFTHLSFLMVHNRTHTGEKPYLCNICGKSFSYVCSLNNHKQLHTGEKQNLCDVCEQCYAAKSQHTVHNFSIRKRSSYEAGFKVKVVEYATANNNCKAAAKFGISEKQVRDWKKNISNLKDMKQTKRASRGKGEQHPEMEGQLLAWLQQQRQNGLEVSRKTIQIKAMEVHRKMSEESTTCTFSASPGWCTRFLNRHNLSLRKNSTNNIKEDGEQAKEQHTVHNSSIGKRSFYEAGFKVKVVEYAIANNNCRAAAQFGISEKQVRDWKKNISNLMKMKKTKRANRGSSKQHPESEEQLIA